MADTHITIPMARLVELETAEHERDVLRRKVDRERERATLEARGLVLAQLVALTARTEKAEAAAAALRAAVEWALGAGDDFPTRGVADGPYYWRHELARRACLRWDGKRYVLDAARARKAGS